MTKLESLMAQRVISAEELADKADVHRNTVSRIKSGKSAYPSTIRKIASALGVEPSELVEAGQASSTTSPPRWRGRRGVAVKADLTCNYIVA